MCLNFAGTGSRILFRPVSSRCRVIPSRKISFNFNGGISYRELARRPWCMAEVVTIMNFSLDDTYFFSVGLPTGERRSRSTWTYQVQVVSMRCASWSSFGTLLRTVCQDTTVTLCDLYHVFNMGWYACNPVTCVGVHFCANNCVQILDSRTHTAIYTA